MNLPESLLLLATPAGTAGTPRGGHRLNLALAGAELAEAAAAGLVRLHGGLLAAPAAHAPGDSDLDGVLAALVHRPRPATPREWLDARHAHVRAVYLTRLGCGQAVQRRPRRMFGLLHTDGYRVADADAYAQTRRRVHEAVHGGGEADQEAAALAALAHLAGLGPSLYPGPAGGAARTAMAALPRAGQASAPVREMLTAVGAAIDATLCAAAVSCR